MIKDQISFYSSDNYYSWIDASTRCKICNKLTGYTVDYRYPPTVKSVVPSVSKHIRSYNRTKVEWMYCICCLKHTLSKIFGAKIKKCDSNNCTINKIVCISDLDHDRSMFNQSLESAKCSIIKGTNIKCTKCNLNVDIISFCDLCIICLNKISGDKLCKTKRIITISKIQNKDKSYHQQEIAIPETWSKNTHIDFTHNDRQKIFFIIQWLKHFEKNKNVKIERNLLWQIFSMGLTDII